MADPRKIRHPMHSRKHTSEREREREREHRHRRHAHNLSYGNRLLLGIFGSIASLVLFVTLFAFHSSGVAFHDYWKQQITEYTFEGSVFDVFVVSVSLAIATAVRNLSLRMSISPHSPLPPQGRAWGFLCLSLLSLSLSLSKAFAAEGLLWSQELLVVFSALYAVVSAFLYALRTSNIHLSTLNPEILSLSLPHTSSSGDLTSGNEESSAFSLPTQNPSTSINVPGVSETTPLLISNSHGMSRSMDGTITPPFGSPADSMLEGMDLKWVEQTRSAEKKKSFCCRKGKDPSGERERERQSGESESEQLESYEIDIGEREKELERERERDTFTEDDVDEFGSIDEEETGDSLSLLLSPSQPSITAEEEREREREREKPEKWPRLRHPTSGELSPEWTDILKEVTIMSRECMENVCTQYKLLTEEWKSRGEKSGVQLWSKKFWRSQLVAGVEISDDVEYEGVAGRTEIPSPPHHVLASMIHPPSRPQWDSLFLEGYAVTEDLLDAPGECVAWVERERERELKGVYGAVRVSYSAFSAPWPVSPREFLFALRREYIPTPEGGIWVLAARSVDSLYPHIQPTKKRERGELILNGYVIRPLKRGGETHTECTLISVFDPCGKIPERIKEMTALKQPMQLANLRNKAGAVAHAFPEVVEQISAVEHYYDAQSS